VRKRLGAGQFRALGRRQLQAIFLAKGIYMRFKDYFYSESKAYEHLSPEKRKLRVTELCVGIGFAAFSTIVVALAFLIRAIYENPHLFRGIQE
jgi:hypothetical protein